MLLFYPPDHDFGLLGRMSEMTATAYLAKGGDPKVIIRHADGNLEFVATLTVSGIKTEPNSHFILYNNIKTGRMRQITMTLDWLARHLQFVGLAHYGLDFASQPIHFQFPKVRISPWGRFVRLLVNSWIQSKEDREIIGYTINAEQEVLARLTKDGFLLPPTFHMVTPFEEIEEGKDFRIDRIMDHILSKLDDQHKALYWEWVELKKNERLMEKFPSIKQKE